tara:strand:- start:332 stop:475 length:144 start_codon:yes stop_codon:yes gene_type:complete
MTAVQVKLFLAVVVAVLTPMVKATPKGDKVVILAHLVIRDVVVMESK